MMHHSKVYKMDKNAASKTLQNIFEASNTTPNQTSFDTLRIRTIANTTLVKVCKWISIVALILVILAPLAFHSNRNFSVDNMKSSSQVTVIDHKLYDDRFVMTLSGEMIDYTGIYCKKMDGKIVMPTVSDKDKHMVEIPFDGDSLNIYITCLDGKIIQAILSK